MHVKFGDTRGRLFSDANDSSLKLAIGEYNMGSGVVTDQGIVIFDRGPNQDTSSVALDQIVELIKTVYLDLFNGELITCYIPKFSSNIYNESMVQSEFLKAFDNITLIPV